MKETLEREVKLRADEGFELPPFSLPTPPRAPEPHAPAEALRAIPGAWRRLDRAERTPASA